MANEIAIDLKLSGSEAFQASLNKSMTFAQNFGNKLSSVGKTLSLSVSAPIIGIGIAALKASTDFNKAMANVGSLIPGNTARVMELKTGIQNLSIQMGKSTDDMAAGMYQTISAFGDGADSLKILEINSKAAVGGVASVTDAINLTSAVTKGYGDTSADAVQQVADLALQTVKLGQTTFPELAASIGRVTPLAASLGVDMTELFGVMATGTGVTGNAAEVSTQLRGVLQGLMAPTGDMTKLLKSMGYASGESMLKQLGLQGAIQTIVAAAEKAGIPLQKYIGSIEGQTLALALAGPQADAFTKKQAAMKEATGTTDAAFKEQTEGVNAAGFAWSKFTQQLTVVTQKLGDALSPALMTVVDNLQSLVDVVISAVGWFAKLDASIQTAAIAFVGLVAVVGPVVLIVGQIVKVFGYLSTAVKYAASLIGVALPYALGKLRIALAVISNMSIYTKAIAALIGAGILLYQNWDTVAHYWGISVNTIKQTLLIAVEIMLDALEHFTGWIPGWGTQISAAATYVRNMRISVEKDMLILPKPVKDVGEAMAKLIAQAQALAGGAQALADALPPAGAGLNALSDAELKAVEKQKELNESLGAMIVNLQQGGADVEDLMNQFVRAGGKLSDTDRLVSSLSASWKENNEWVGENIVTAQNQRNATFELIKTLYTLETQVVNSGLSIADLTKNITWSGDASKDLESMISALTDGLKDNKKSVADLNEEFGEQILKAKSLGINVSALISKLNITGNTAGHLKIIMTELGIEINELDKDTKNVITTQSLWEVAVRGVADSIKGIWNGTTTTFKDVWHGALDAFVDTLAQMVIQAQWAGMMMNIAMSVAMGAIGLVVGLIGMAFSGKKSTIEVVPITVRLKEVFDDFVENFKSAIGERKEYLFPAKVEASTAFADINQAIDTMGLLGTFKASVAWEKNVDGELATLTKIHDSWEGWTDEFPEVTEAINNLNQGFKDAGIDISIETKKWKNWSGTFAETGVALSTIDDQITKAATKLAGSAVEFGELMEGKRLINRIFPAFS